MKLFKYLHLVHLAEQISYFRKPVELDHISVTHWNSLIILFLSKENQRNEN